MSASTTMKASDEVLNVLKKATIDDDGLTLVGTLDRKMYQDVNKFLEAAGAKWNKKAGCHLFSGNAKEEIASLLAAGSIVHKQKLYQSFYTPKDIAKKLVQMAGVMPSENCLEPSAGHGAIAREIEARHARVVCVDIDPVAVHQLALQLMEVHEQDFLALTSEQLHGPFDRIVMNPPFSKNQAFLHVIHAHSMLRAGGILVTILPCSAPSGKKLRADWDNLIAVCGEFLEDLPEGTFKQSGTAIRTRVLRLVG